MTTPILFRRPLSSKLHDKDTDDTSPLDNLTIKKLDEEDDDDCPPLEPPLFRQQ
jgi:hypothetical protein